MRILAVGTAQSPVDGRWLPGIVGKRCCGVVAVTTALALSLCGAALAQTGAPVPERISGTGSQQSGPVTERTYSEAPASSASKSADFAPTVAPAAAVTPSVAPDDGLGALAIVLISVGGAMALGAAAYTARRFMHHGHGPATG